MMMSLPEGYRAVVIGASGAIGSALLEQLQSDPRCAVVIGVSRQSLPGLDLLSEASIAASAQALAGQGPFHLVVDATGALTTVSVASYATIASIVSGYNMRDVLMIAGLIGALWMLYKIMNASKKNGGER